MNNLTDDGEFSGIARKTHLQGPHGWSAMSLNYCKLLIKPPDFSAMTSSTAELPHRVLERKENDKTITLSYETLLFNDAIEMSLDSSQTSATQRKGRTAWNYQRRKLHR